MRKKNTDSDNKSVGQPMKNIWMVTREYGNLAGAGGVRDMVRQLSVNLAKWHGRTVSVVMPLYGFMDLERLGFAPVHDPLYMNRQLAFAVQMNFPFNERTEHVEVFSLTDKRVTVYGLFSERFSEKKDVYVYQEEDEQLDAWKVKGSGHQDYFAMNILLQKGALELIMHLGERPDVIHCHDGHTAVLPVMIDELPGYSTYFRSTGSVLSIHNAGFGYHQEVADLPFAQTITGLTWKTVQSSLLGGKFDPFVCAAGHAVINAVSENYAHELQHTDADRMTGWLGHELLQRGVIFEGVTNGIDPSEYNPSEHEKVGIAASYSIEAQELEGKKACKQELIRLLDGAHGLPAAQYGYLDNTPEVPLFTFIGRLNEQKGVDVLLPAVSNYLSQNKPGQFVILGSGERYFENQFHGIANNPIFQGRVCFLQGFSPALANQVYAAGDFFLIPSRFEPCGLTDFIAQLFGNLPIVHLIGGLVKVSDGETGFGYGDNSPDGLMKTMMRAADVFTQPEQISIMQKNAKRLIDQEYNWSIVMKKYLDLYNKAAVLNSRTHLTV